MTLIHELAHFVTGRVGMKEGNSSQATRQAVQGSIRQTHTVRIRRRNDQSSREVENLEWMARRFLVDKEIEHLSDILDGVSTVRTVLASLWYADLAREPRSTRISRARNHKGSGREEAVNARSISKMDPHNRLTFTPDSVMIPVSRIGG